VMTTESEKLATIDRGGARVMEWSLSGVPTAARAKVWLLTGRSQQVNLLQQ
jgi:hypothetical protein